MIALQKSRRMRIPPYEQIEVSGKTELERHTTFEKMPKKKSMILHTPYII